MRQPAYKKAKATHPTLSVLPKPSPHPPPDAYSSLRHAFEFLASTVTLDEAVEALGNRGLVNDQVMSLLQSSNLTTLNISTASGSPATTPLRSGFSCLEQLNVSNRLVGVHDMLNLCGVSSLRSLILDNTGLTNVHIFMLVSLQMLEQLSLWGNIDITDEAGPALRQLRLLEYLCIVGTSITSALTELLPMFKTPRPLRDERMKSVAAALAPNPTISPAALLDLAAFDEEEVGMDLDMDCTLPELRSATPPNPGLSFCVRSSQSPSPMK
ncbi:hypothetical protein C8R46DRAFT_146141 [Mycena filopes]|nr:hypothetical protein C8R46DRAFT_146141 [Mycena filopes]